MVAYAEVVSRSAMAERVAHPRHPDMNLSGENVHCSFPVWSRAHTSSRQVLCFVDSYRHIAQPTYMSPNEGVKCLQKSWSYFSVRDVIIVLRDRVFSSSS